VVGDHVGHMATRVVVVGGGILGTMHAWFARRRGVDVIQVERDVAPRRGMTLSPAIAEATLTELGW
jgi:glycine/D-amino acid oxidase-like deaminating enzyme